MGLASLKCHRQAVLSTFQLEPLSLAKDTYAPHIKMAIEELQIIGFLDAGSTVSAVNQSTADLIGSDLLDKPKRMRSASGIFTVTHVVMATVDLGLGPMKHMFYVMPTIKKRALLGYDFQKKFKISVNPEDDTFTIQGKKFKFCEPDGSTAENNDSLCIHLLEHVEYIIDNQEIESVNKDKFLDLIAEFAEIFNDRPTLALVEPMKINTGDASPKRQRVRLINDAKRLIATAYTQEQLDLGIMCPSNSPWGSNYVFVTKKDTTELRPCGDFREVNSVTVFDAYPMPDVKTILYRIAIARVFSTFDMAKGFNQIPLDKIDRIKTAIFTPLGLMEFKVMPFGLKNAPAVFQRAMEMVLGDLLQKCCLVYIDDVIVFSENEDDHLEHLREFFLRIQKFRFRINPKKIQLIRRKIKILGHIIQNGYYTPDPSKIEGIQCCPLPTTRTQLRSFLGLVSYYRNFVKHLAHVAGPLYKLTSKNAPAKITAWSSEAIEAFELIKKIMCDLILHTPDLNGTFTVQCDASGYGLGGVLLAEFEGALKPVCYISRNLKDPEKNYSVTEQECLAVVWSCEKFRPFIECTKFTVVTDHKALTWLTTMKDPKGRLARWALRMQGFNYEIGYRPGALNHVPDMLSRNPVNLNDDDFLPEVFEINELEEISLNKFPLFEAFKREHLVAAQKDDTQLSELRSFMLTGVINQALVNIDKQHIIQMAKNAFEMEDGLLVRYCNPFNELSFMDELNYERIIIPAKLRNLVCRRLHDDPTSGHLGADITYTRIQKRFYWPNMYKFIQKYVKSCHTCQMVKSNNEKPFGLMRISTPTLPWEKVSIDLIGPFPKSRLGNEFGLVIIDTCTGWPEVFPLRKAAPKAKIKPAERCADKTLSVFCRWGFPARIVSDSGPQFASELWTSVMKLLKINTVFVSPYHPQANPVERKNKDVKNYLKKYIGDNHKFWDENLDPMLFALRSAKIKSTGLSPFEANFGRNPKAPLDVILPEPTYKGNFGSNVHDYAKRTIERLKSASQYLLDNRELAGIEQKLYYDPNHKEMEFNIGDYVTIIAHALSSKAKNFSSGLAPNREGPYIIIGKPNPLNYELGDVNSKEPRTFAHVVQLKKYTMREDQPVITDSIIPDAIIRETTKTVAKTKVNAKPKSIGTKAQFGLGKSRGRPKGKPNAPVLKTKPEGKTKARTRSQTRLEKEANAATNNVTNSDIISPATVVVNNTANTDSNKQAAA